MKFETVDIFLLGLYVVLAKFAFKANQALSHFWPQNWSDPHPAKVSSNISVVSRGAEGATQ